ncbi:MAG TPA: retropepsin-like aspartic protease, partial [Methylomirabilota bacterium]|nr:retropepsin-like aspartic protease [Methylomirabilota bacterium]
VDLEFESSSKYCHNGKRLDGQNSQPTKNPYSLYTPLLLQNERVLGLVDTGADFSAISLDWLTKNKISRDIIPVNGKIHFAGHGHDTDRFGITKPLQIKYNGRTITHSFEVMKLQEGTNVLLGFDIMPKLGISLTGVAFK